MSIVGVQSVFGLFWAKNRYWGKSLYQLMYQWDAWLSACGGPFFNSIPLPRAIPKFEQLTLQSEIN
jgi:hypothetical protein